MPALIYELELPWETPSNNKIKGMNHFAYKRLRENWRMAVMAALGGSRFHDLPPLSPVAIEIDRYSKGPLLDWDNAYGGLKPLLDCLVMKSRQNPDGLGLIVDDSPRHVPEPPKLRQVRIRSGQNRTILRIYADLP